ncbi:MAG: hypothetical protein LC623_02145 [Halobacteriales archaeon]|nr:hypothetical protein [Halobacteriales archaeon]
MRSENHRFNLQVLQRLPHDLEYVTPQEILVLLRLCNAYGVDWTVGLEPESDNDPTRLFAYRVPDLEGHCTEWKECRVRRERLLQDPHGVLVPDGDIVWAQQLIGLLHAAIDEALDTGRP